MLRLLPVCAGALALLPFVPALSAGFVNWDDTVMLLSQTGYRSLGARGLGWMLTSTVMGHWSPLAWLSFALDFSLGGLEPRVYHATNLALHALNATLVCVVARLLLRPVLCPRGGEAAVGAGALGAALLFAVHPLRAETVAWISDRRDLLCATFVLVSVWAYLRGVAARGRVVGGWRLASLAAFAAALASKGFGLILPLILLALDHYPLRRSPLGWRTLAWGKAPYAALAVAAALLTAAAVRSSAAVADYAEYGPAGLSPLYELPAQVSLLAPRFLFPTLAALAVTVTLVQLRHRWPAGLAAWAASLILLAPVSGIVLAGRHVAADRYTYRPDLPGPHRNLGALLVMGARWAEAEAVFAEVLRRWPTSADGPAGLAAAREGAGDAAGAVALLRLAVALDPGFGGARLELSRLERILEERRMPARPVW